MTDGQCTVVLRSGIFIQGLTFLQQEIIIWKDMQLNNVGIGMSPEIFLTDLYSRSLPVAAGPEWLEDDSRCA